MSKGKVILVRGVSGAGKSTHVGDLYAKYVSDNVTATGFTACSADSFFYKNGEYLFDASLLGEAHSKCFSKFMSCMRNGEKVIVVDNTFIRMWELENYYKAALSAGYVVEVHEIQIKTIDELRICINRNVHKVPGSAVSRMAVDFESVSHLSMPGEFDVIQIPFKGGVK
jgi:hypothetical protein